MLLGVHVVGVCLDFAAAIRYPFELDYGEGIVWQQAALIPGPRMFSASTDLPFIVFHYPPLFHLLARGARLILPDFLAAGRLVASFSTILIAPLVSGIVLLATSRQRLARDPAEIAIAVAVGALVQCLHAFRSWGMYMRVDMPGVALGLLGLLVGAWAAGRFWGTTCALLLCGAAVYTKQTELPAGIAVFLIALLRNPRAALGAGAIAGCACLGVLALLQVKTSGGFLLNIIGYNQNTITLRHAYWVFAPERNSLPVILLLPLAAWVVCRSVVPAAFSGRLRLAIRQIRELRTTEKPVVCRALVLLDFGLASLMLFTIFKAGSSYNYLLDWLGIGCVLVGIMLVDVVRARAWHGWAYPLAILILLLAVAAQPFRQTGDIYAPGQRALNEQMVQRIAVAVKPVASENMTLLMRAGKQVIFEPAIVSELAKAGIWDETPLLRMIDSGGFAFMITRDNDPGGNVFRTPAVDAAMRAAYPRVEEVTPKIWLHLPAG